MGLFSQRHGHRPVKDIVQTDSMDDDLRIGLWNALEIFYFSQGELDFAFTHSDNKSLNSLFFRLYIDYFKIPLDTMPSRPGQAIARLREYYFSCKWFNVYDIIEFVPDNFPVATLNERFVDYCNSIMEREVSGYRFVGNKIAPLTSKEEVDEIEEALQVTSALEPVAIHLKSALDKFSDRKSPDYRNSIKESISAVEAMSSLIVGKDRASLGDALKEVNDKIALHAALIEAFKKLYGYTSDAEGIRHALLDEPTLDSEDARFMLIAASAFVNYLKVKASKAGLV